jgi:hypothetical protein
MTKKAYRRLIAGHLQLSILSLIIALFVAFITSDHRSVVYGVPAAESSVTGVSNVPAPLPSTAPVRQAQGPPASAPSPPAPKGGALVPDTVNGELVWPDPWDQISDIPLRNY